LKVVFVFRRVGGFGKEPLDFRKLDVIERHPRGLPSVGEHS
jgi:hypothetical protein